MTRFTKLVALFSFALLVPSTVACGRSDLLSYDQLPNADGGPGSDAAVDGHTGPNKCTSSEGCASTPKTPYCELPPGVCVGCLTSPDTCPVGEACNPSTHQCVPTPGGCTSNSQCPATKPYCDLPLGECVGCLQSSQCPPGDICQDNECVGYCGGGASCSQGLSCCSSACVDEGTNPDDCGACGRICPSGEACLGGACQPPTGCQTAGCSSGDTCCSDSCVNTKVSPYHCGSCTNVCATGATCVGGVCQSQPSCNGGPVCTGVDSCCPSGCTDTRTDPANCGTCAYACPTGYTCVAGSCEIPAGCNGGPACTGVLQCCKSGCTNIDTSPSNCGACGNKCQAEDTCVAGECKAPASCNGGPVCTGVDQCCAAGCTDIDADPDNCGGCGIVCGYGASCVGAVCQATCNGGPLCTGVDTCCSVGCIDTRNNPDNCGGCGFVCPSGYTCVDSSCTPPASCHGGPVCTGVQQCCATGCVDVDTNPDDCGECGLACPPEYTCVAGTCTPPASCDGGPVCTGVDQCCSFGCTDIDTDSSNCGACGNVCPYYAPCVGAVCQPTCDGGPACTGVDQCCSLGCTDTQTDPNNCSGCGYMCPTGWTCVTGSCTPPASCHGGPVCTGVEQCCSSGCTNIDTDPKNCGYCGDVCPSGYTCVGAVCTPPASCHGGPVCTGVDQCCASGCTDIDTDSNNCGSCGNVCPYEGPCVGAVCQPTCNGGPACTGIDQCCSSGCTDTETDPNNCGYCGGVCAAGYTCVYGSCTPPASCHGGPVCTGVDQCCANGCTNIDTDPDNCGYCGEVCAPGYSCVGAVCTPSTSCNGGPVCTGGDQCCPSGCTNTDTDPANCGSCGNACVPGGTCAGGACQTCNGGPICTGTDQCCPGGCVNTTSDPNNCGSCGHVCASGDSCIGGACQTSPACGGGPACTTGDTCCSNACVNTTSDANNCGGCGNVCQTGYSCVASTCTPNGGVFNPIVNPTYLSPGAHAYTSIDIPAGVTVYVAGAGSNSGTLTLSATGPVTIAGKIDLSGGPGTQNTVTSQNSEEGEAGGGGYTGEPYESAPFSAACAFVAGNGGSLGYAIAGTAGTCPIASTTTCIDQSYYSESLLFAAPPATYGGGGGVFTGYRAYGGGGGGPAGGAPGGLGPAYGATSQLPAESDCSGASGGGGAVNGQGGAGTGVYAGGAGVIGQTQCAGLYAGVPAAYVGGGGGGSIGAAAIADLPVASTFQTGSAGGGGSADYLNRPVFGGTSGGGGGGGALMITSTTSISITGQVLANGGVGGDAVLGIGSDAQCNPQPGAAGGGGSGGVIYLSAPTLTVSSGAVVSAKGGAGGFGSEFATGGGGGAGGMGRVRLSLTGSGCSTLAGSFTPGLPAGCAAGVAQPGSTYIGTYPN